MPTLRQQLGSLIQGLCERQGLAVPSDGDLSNGSLVQAARRAGLRQEQIMRGVAEALGVEFSEDLSDVSASSLFIDKVPIDFARDHAVLGLSGDNGTLRVAVGDLKGLRQLDVLARHLGKPVEPVLSTGEQVAAAINRVYQQQRGAAESFIQKLDRGQVLAEVKQLQGREDLLNTTGRAPVIKLVNLMLFEAVQQEASDVHVQPYEDRLIVRMRIDGVLFDAFELPAGIQDEVASRIKVMGRMNIAEKRLPQDGRATVQVGDRVIDLRLSAVPASFGERVVIRLLDKSRRLFALDDLGMEAMTLALYKRLITLEHGLILVTGPTGSGKSTTLYAALKQIDCKQHNIITLEDPIEYQVPGVSQIQVSERKGMTFASGLRSVLRQDPDIIMVGEIRDRETAVMAIQSALTGHLVFSTLHTNDAASAVTRLLDLGIEPYLVASSLLGVLAQRLVRKVCPQCGAPYEANEQECQFLGLTPEQAGAGVFRQGVGCGSCRKTGYQGRMGIFEMLTVSDPIRQLVQQRATASQIKSAAVANGMRTLQEDGLGRAMRGQTTVEEVARVTLRETLR